MSFEDVQLSAMSKAKINCGIRTLQFLIRGVLPQSENRFATLRKIKSKTILIFFNFSTGRGYLLLKKKRKFR